MTALDFTGILFLAPGIGMMIAFVVACFVAVFRF